MTTRLKTKAIPVCAALFIAAGTIATVAPAGAATDTARAQLETAISTSDAAYQGSVHSQFEVSQQKGDAAEILARGSTGILEYSPDSGNYDTAWEEWRNLQDGSVVREAAMRDESGYEVFTSMRTIATRAAWSPKTRAIVAAHVRKKGGNGNSLVRDFGHSGPYEAEVFDGAANPASYLKGLLDIAGDKAEVTLDESSATGYKFTVTDTQSGLVVDVSTTPEWVITGIRNVLEDPKGDTTSDWQVVSYGPDATIPDFVKDRVDTSIAQYATDFTVGSRTLKTYMNAAHQTARALAELAGGKAVKAAIRAALEETGILQNTASFKVRGIKQGYAVSYNLLPEVRSIFGAACTAIVAAGTDVKLQGCK